MGDYQYDQLVSINGLKSNIIISTGYGTDELHLSPSFSPYQSKMLQGEDDSSSSCNLFDQRLLHSEHFNSIYLGSLMELGELSSLLP
jgi:hypothetical protein